MYKQLELLFSSSVDKNIELARGQEDARDRNWLEALRHTLCASLLVWKEKEIDKIGLFFEGKVGMLPKMHLNTIKSVLTKEQPAILKVKGNKQRKGVLGKRAHSLAEEVADGTLQHVLTQVLVVLNSRLRKSFEAVVRQTHSLMQAAIQKGDTQELERSGAFPISQHYARFTAGLIAAVHQSGLATAQLNSYAYLKEILTLAQQPAIMVSAGQGLEALFQETEDDDPMDAAPSELAAPDNALPAVTQPNASEWQCHNCGCPASKCNEQEAGPYPLSTPCRFNPGTCWCEHIDQHAKFCRLCVRYYKDHLTKSRVCKPRPAKLEKQRLKRHNTAAPMLQPAAKRRRSSISSTSFSGVQEI